MKNITSSARTNFRKLLILEAFFHQGLAPPWLEVVDGERIQGFALPPISHESKIPKCLKDFYEEKICVGEILLSIWHHKVTVDSKCCSLIDRVIKDCLETYFAELTQSFFNIVLKNYCAHK